MLLKTLWEKEKMLEDSIFPLSPNFYPFREELHHNNFYEADLICCLQKLSV